MKSGVFGIALAMIVAGASSLSAEERHRPRDDAWRSFLERCDRQDGPRRVVKKKHESRLGRALSRLSEAERDRLRERLRRIELMTQAWIRSQQQARAMVLGRHLMAGLVPALRVPVDLRPAMQFIMQLNGFGTKRHPGILGRRGKQMMI